MPGYLRQSTSQIIRFGPFLDSTDGVTAETALTIAQADMQLSKDGGAFAQKNTTGNATHDTDGWYSTTLDATDTATTGILIMKVAVSGSVPVWHEFYVVEEAIYDDLFASSATGYLAPTTAGRTLDVTATGAAGIDWGNVENPTTTLDLSATNINLVDTATAVTNDVGITQAGADKAWSTTARVLTAATNITSDASAITMSSSGVVGTVNLVNTTTTNTDMRGTDSALLASSAPTNFSDLAITVTTGQVTVGTNSDKTGYSISGTITTLDGLNDISAAQVNAEVVDVLTVDTFAEPSGVPSATSSIKDKLAWLFALGRNKVTQTATTQTLRNDADSGNIATSTVSDDGTTTTRGKYS